MDKIVERHRRYLPHIQLEGQIISLTWRLAFSLPRPVLLLWEALKKNPAEVRLSPEASPGVHSAEYLQKLGEYDDALGRLKPERVNLCAEEIGTMLGKAFRFYDGELYELHCFCVMPNHVHILLRPLRGSTGTYHLDSDIVRRLKSYTAKRINALLGRQGELWQPDYFDRFIRDPEDYFTVVRYILENPVKAGLARNPEQWRQAYYRPGLI